MGENTDRWTSLRKMDPQSTLHAWCDAVYQAASQTPEWDNWHTAVCFAIVALNKQSSAEQAIEELRNMSAIDPANLIIADVITNAHQYIVNDAEMCKEMITDEIKVSQQEWAKLRTCGPQIITDILAIWRVHFRLMRQLVALHEGVAIKRVFEGKATRKFGRAPAER
jgi:hypothetical protein